MKEAVIFAVFIALSAAEAIFGVFEVRKYRRGKEITSSERKRLYISSIISGAERTVLCAAAIAVGAIPAAAVGITPIKTGGVNAVISAAADG